MTGKNNTDAQRKKIKVCFHVLHSYSLFDTATQYYFGGAEFRSSIFATSLAAYPDVEVTFITHNHLQNPAQTIRGVKVLADRYYRSATDYSTFFSRLLNRSNSALLKLNYIFRSNKNKRYEKYLKEYWLEKTDADYYISFSTTFTSLEVADFCIENKKKYLHFIASDNQVRSENFEQTNRIISKAHIVFAQNQFQHQALKEVFHTRSIVISNPIEIKPETEAIAAKKRKKILWIGKADSTKRPQLFIELAKLNPEKDFVMICNNSDAGLFRTIRGSLPANVTFYESLSLEATEKIIAGSYIFVSTSKEEGFPNTFLQAGNNGVPVLSISVDPDNYLTKYNCGNVCNDSLQTLNTDLNNLFSDEGSYRAKSFNHYKYVCDHHDKKNIVKLLYEHLKKS